MSVTWALFKWTGISWQFAGMAAHDELATEFEEECDALDIECLVVSLEDPIPTPLHEDVQLLELEE